MNHFKFNRVLSLALFFILGACSSAGLKERAKLRDLLAQKNYAESLSYVKGSEFYKDKDNKLLLNLELGLINHMSGQYFQSVKYLEKAKKIHKKLFTKSIRLL